MLFGGAVEARALSLVPVHRVLFCHLPGHVIWLRVPSLPFEKLCSGGLLQKLPCVAQVGNKEPLLQGPGPKAVPLRVSESQG